MTSRKTTTRSYYPSARSLLAAWALLIVLTLATMVSGRVTQQGSLGLALLIPLLLVTWGKANVILRTYLNLRTVPAAADALAILIALILAVVATLYALAV